MASLRLSPWGLLLGNAGLAAAGVALALYLSVNQPWLGLGFATAMDEPGLQIASLATGSPAVGVLIPGQRVLAIGSENAGLPLNAGDLIEDPDFLVHYRDYNVFLARQDRLHRALRDSPLVFQTAAGQALSVLPASMRPVSDLPPAFWFQLVFAVACLCIAAAVWAFRRSTAAMLFAVTGLGLFVVGLTAAVYSTRELAMGAPMFRVLAAADHAGGMLFAAGYLATLWHYPQRLSRFPLGWSVLLLYGLLWAADTLQWLPNVDAGFRVPIMAGLAVSALLAWLQWRRSDSPLDRASLRWFLFSWFFGSSLFAALMFVPVLLGGRPLLPQSYSFGLLLLIYAGIALGVARYRLFDLEHWFSPILAGSIALLAGLIVVPVLLRFSQVSPAVTILVLVAVIGWIYFPVRSALARRTRQRMRKRTAPVLAQAVDMLFDPARPGNVDKLWQAVLQQAFSPLELAAAAQPPLEVRIDRDGSTMTIPATPHTRAYSLRWAERGARLFDPADISTAQALLPLTTLANDLRAAWESGAATERARIKRDLEDDLAARLYAQILRMPDAAAGPRSMLAEVRLVIDQLGARRVDLAQALSEWRAQIEDLCELSQIQLHWRQPERPPQASLGPQAWGNPLRILREAVSNAIDHARPTYMEVAVKLDLPDIELVVAHDGVDQGPQTWNKGRGLLNINTRAQQLAGEVGWSQTEPGCVEMRVRLRLDPAL